ncbi:hypothetical protein M3P05_11100 [Sansalvadorimonas sp. 2012CJ34-2]|uniref:Uncharacterized protein n=1 Tax=Parendozoicomonas callyspongiae TaxID=2942213 RepID=A0ABT0PGG4_9GAMM|nr:hypothetical protein [Sansalvadorimonas sp. 2012CJ34-2]MCL6270468.1 hypothetical protein [Sansalvadorimonas sp. 2012CJ34-2]
MPDIKPPYSALTLCLCTLIFFSLQANSWAGTFGINRKPFRVQPRPPLKTFEGYNRPHNTFRYKARAPLRTNTAFVTSHSPRLLSLDTQELTRKRLSQHALAIPHSERPSAVPIEAFPIPQVLSHAIFRNTITPREWVHDPDSPRAVILTYDQLPEYQTYVLSSPTDQLYPDFLMSVLDKFEIKTYVQSVGGDSSLFYIQHSASRQSKNSVVYLYGVSSGGPRLLSTIKDFPTVGTIQPFSKNRVLFMIPNDYEGTTTIKIICASSGTELLTATIHQPENSFHVGAHISPDKKSIMLVEECVSESIESRKIIPTVIKTRGGKKKNGKFRNKVRRRKTIIPPNVDDDGDPVPEIRDVKTLRYTYKLSNLQLSIDGINPISFDQAMDLAHKPLPAIPFEIRETGILTRPLLHRMTPTLSNNSKEQALVTLEKYHEDTRTSSLITYLTNGYSLECISADINDLSPLQTSTESGSYGSHLDHTASLPATEGVLRKPRPNKKVASDYPYGQHLRRAMNLSPHLHASSPDSYIFSPQKMKIKPEEKFPTSEQRGETNDEQKNLSEIDDLVKSFWRKEQGKLDKDYETMTMSNSFITLLKPGSDSVKSIVVFDRRIQKIYSTTTNRPNRQINAAPLNDGNWVIGLVSDRINAIPIARFKMHTEYNADIKRQATPSMRCFLLDDDSLVCVPLLGNPYLFILPEKFPVLKAIEN